MTATTSATPARTAARTWRKDRVRPAGGAAVTGSDAGSGAGSVVAGGSVTRALHHAAAPRAPVPRRSLRATKSMIAGTPSRR